MEGALERLKAASLVAVIRAPSQEALIPLVGALMDGGVRGIEVTMSTPNAIEGIAELRRIHGDRIVLGVGTALDTATCHQAEAAGSEFVVSPVFDPEVVAETKLLGMLSLPGAFSPTEALAAWRAGADVVKIFPAGAVGPSYFKDLLAPMPFLRLMPTGGVDLGTVAAWFSAGAFAVGVGSALFPKEMVASGDWPGITRLAEQFRQLCPQK